MEFIRASQLEQFVEESKAILAEHGDKIVLPADLACVEDGERREVAVADAARGRSSSSTSATRPPTDYGVCIAAAGTVFVNGPAGVFEQLGDRVRHPGAVGGDGGLARASARSAAATASPP